MATETRTETELSDSMGRIGISGDNGDDNRLGPDGEPAPRTDEEYAQSQLTLRAIVSSKEAGVIIGKAGKNVADLRDETGVKAGVSKVVQGVHDRVLTVTGGLDSISKAYAIVAKGLLEGAPQMGMGGVISTNGTHRKSYWNPSYTSLCHPILWLPSTSSQMADMFPSSHSSAHLTPPNGHNHRSTGTQDQTNSGCIRRSHGCAERDATTVNRANC